MPYTPPSQQSPIASRPESPSLSRSQSTEKVPQRIPSGALAPRQGLPRSQSSTSISSKHRRSPSITKFTSFAATPSTPAASSQNSDPQEGLTVTDRSKDRGTSDEILPNVGSPLKSRGIEISPPDSSQPSSDDDESRNARKGRDRELENLVELQAAIRIIQQHREYSPNRVNEETKKAKLALDLVPQLQDSDQRDLSLNRPPLSKEARKIAHSRSATDSLSIQDFTRPGYRSEGPSLTESEVEDDGDDDDGSRAKPLIVRKKSGELVRPALRPPSARRRPSSMPGTPTYSKAVHFDSQLEHVRTFLRVDRPVNVSASSSPQLAYQDEAEFPFGAQGRSFEWEINLPNYPRETIDRKRMPVRVERIVLSSDNSTLVGHIAVANLAFHKLVVARFTLDNWTTTSEVGAEYDNQNRRTPIDDGSDPFLFTIKLANHADIENKTMFFCVRYNVNGQEYWDNNSCLNFQVKFTKKTKLGDVKQGAAVQPQNALPHSKASPPTSSGRPRPLQTSFDDFADGFESPYELGTFSSAKVIGDSPIRFRNSNPPKDLNRSKDPISRTNVAGQVFGNRYDFGASLTAAMQSSLNKDDIKSLPGEKSFFTDRPVINSSIAATPTSVDASKTTQLAANSAIPAASKLDVTKPAALTSEKPSVQSPSYHELLDKYCFFGSSKSSIQSAKPGHSQSDGASDDKLATTQNTFTEPAQPSSPQEQSRTAENPVSPKTSVSTSRLSRSPSPATGQGMGSINNEVPVSFGYPYVQPMKNDFFTGSNASTAIQG